MLAQAFLALFFLILGAMGLLLRWSDEIKLSTIQFIESDPLIFTLFGGAFLLIGIGLAAQFFHSFKRKYTTISQKELTIDISEDVIEDYLRTYFHEIFPLQEVPFRLTLKKQKAKVVIDLPTTQKDDQKSLIKKIEDDLTDLFRERLGWRRELTLSFGFAPSKS